MIVTHDVDDRFEHRLCVLEETLVRPNFPDRASFDASPWAEWITRVKAGEEKIIQDLSRDEASSDLEFDARQWVESDLSEAAFTRNNMHGAMVVALWSAMEYFLRETLRSYIEEVHTNESRKQLKSWRQISFKKLKGEYERLLEIDCEQLPEHETTDAIRVLSNSFKHGYGYYEPDDKPHSQIAQHLLDTWAVVDEHGEIAYSRLPFPDLMQACHEFSKAILERVRSHFREVRND